MGQTGGDQVWVREDGGQIDYAIGAGDAVSHFGTSIDVSSEKADGNYHTIAIVYDGPAGEVRAYVDGALKHTNTDADIGTLPSTMLNNTADFRLGSYNGSSEFDGTLDQFRISSIALPPSQFLPILPTIDNAAATGIQYTSADFNGTLTSTGGAPTSVWLYWGDDDAGTNGWDNTNAFAGTILEGAALSTNISGLSVGTTYYYRYYCSNADGSTWAAATTNVTTDTPAPRVWDNGAATENWLTDVNWTGNTWDNVFPDNAVFTASADVNLNGDINQSGVDITGTLTLANTAGGTVTLDGAGGIDGAVGYSGPNTLKLDHTGGWASGSSLELTGGTVWIGNTSAVSSDVSVKLGSGTTMQMGDGAPGSFTVGEFMDGAGTIESAAGGGNTAELVLTTSEATGSGDTGLQTVFRDGSDGSVLALRKSASGTIGMQGSDNNTFTGDVAIDVGTIRCDVLADKGAPSTLGAGDTIHLGTATTQGQVRYHGGDKTIDRDFVLGAGGGSFDITGSGSGLTIAGSVSGAELRKTGVGRVRLSGSQKTYTGKTRIDTGRLYTDADNVLPAGTSLEINGGVLLLDNHSQTVKELYSDSSPGDVYFGTGSGDTLTISGQTVDRTFYGRLRERSDIVWQPVTTGADWTLDGSGVNDYTGSFTVNSSDPYTRLRLQKDAAGTTAINGDLTVTKGQVGLYQDNQVDDNADVTVTLGAGGGSGGSDGVFLTRNFDETIGSLQGDGDVFLGGSSVLQVGANDSSFGFSGDVNEGGEVVKVGTGVWTFSGRFLSGAIAKRVSAGALLFDGTDATGAWTVNTGGTLGGTGTLSGTVTVDVGGTLAPGSAGVGALGGTAATINGTYAVEVSGAAGDRLDLTGNLDLGASSVLTISGTPTAAVYTLIEYDGIRSGTFDTAPSIPFYEIVYDDANKRVLLDRVEAKATIFSFN